MALSHPTCLQSLIRNQKICNCEPRSPAVKWGLDTNPLMSFCRQTMTFSWWQHINKMKIEMNIHKLHTECLSLFKATILMPLISICSGLFQFQNHIYCYTTCTLNRHSCLHSTLLSYILLLLLVLVLFIVVRRHLVIFSVKINMLFYFTFAAVKWFSQQ